MFFNKNKYQIKQIRNKLIKRFNAANDILKSMEVPDSLIDREIIAIRNILLNCLYTSTIRSLAENVEEFEEAVCNYKLKVLKEGFLTKGEIGYTGMQGPMGMKGERGESAYEIAVRHGFEGTEEEWIELFKPEHKKVNIKEFHLGSNIPITDGSSNLDNTYWYSKINDKIESVEIETSIHELPKQGSPGYVYVVSGVHYYWNGEYYSQVTYLKVTPKGELILHVPNEKLLFSSLVKCIKVVDKLPEISEPLTAYLLKSIIYCRLDGIWTIIGRSTP